MWRSAHGRLAAIVVLAGGLLGCAAKPAPTPPRHARTISPGGPPYEHPACGGYEPDTSPTPEERRAVAVRAIERAVGLRCAVEEKSARRYGEIRLELRRGPDIEPSITSARSGSLTEADRQCVEEAARAVVQREDILAGDFATDPVIYLPLGTWQPLFPRTERFTARWLAALRSSPGRKRFEAQLPPDVRLEETGCVSIPVRPAFADSLERWLATVESPLDGYWQEPRPDDWSRRGLFSDLGPPGGHATYAYWLKDRVVLLHRKQLGRHGRQELCLLAMDRTLREKIRRAVDDRGTCWVGDLDEIVLRPRAEFPADRRFKAVAVGDRHACALDDGGAAVCCGERFHDDPPAEPLSAIAAGSEFDCGITARGAIRCWGRLPPAGGDPIPGPFEQLAIFGRELCAVRRGAKAVECWGPGAPGLAAAPGRWDDFKRATAAAGGPCAVTADGRVDCDPVWPYRREPVEPGL